ncbi:hypothetical protein MA16_Dca007914 [Dendrobium catenatum]|uniref:Retrotransposon gag domain-containing protein n=1 Tax=Dendrobium catenatum TaxID=906689 RepID=A0A2I0XJ82_9ASPA|nr:hypothetical protein MA16_Dca007914 [Dendrobium catenatum]
MPHSVFQPRPEFKPQRPHFEPPYRLPTFDGSSDPYYFREWVRQLQDYFESCHIPESHQVSIAKFHLKGRALQFWARLEDHKESRGEYTTWKDMRRELNLKYRPSTNDRHLEPHHTFGGTNSGHYWGRVHPSFSNDRVAVPPCRSSLSLGDRPFSGSSVGSSPYDSPLGPTSSHPNQPLAAPVRDPASVLLIKNCINKETPSEPKTECIHFVDANDIKDNEDFFEDGTNVIESDSLIDLNPELGKLEPYNVDTLTHPDPSLLEAKSLDKVCLDDSSVISEETNRTSNTLDLNLEDPDLVVTPTDMTPDNSDLILDKSDLALDNSELILDNSDGDLDNPELEVSQSKPDLSETEPMDLRVTTKPESLSEDITLSLKVFEPDLNNEPHLVSLESNFRAAQLDLYLAECVIPDSYILPVIASSYQDKDHFYPSWMTLLDYTAGPRRLTSTLSKTFYGSALVAKDVFIAPPTPVPLDMETFLTDLSLFLFMCACESVCLCVFFVVCFIPKFPLFTTLCDPTIHAHLHCTKSFASTFALHLHGLHKEIARPT